MKTHQKIVPLNNKGSKDSNPIIINIQPFEKKRYDYLHVDANGDLHCFIPILGCTEEIGTDNTCKTTYVLKKMFGIGAEILECSLL